jgi:hypothetical protein
MTGYSVTLPAFAAGQPGTDNRNAILDWRLFGLLGVRSIASAFEIQGTEPFPPCQFRNLFLYMNPYPMPRVWGAADIGSWDVPIAVREDGVESESPNRLRMSASGPGILVVSEVSYPAWRATVDGKTAELLTVGGWWRAVAIGPGEHTVEMEYDPILSRIGLAITALALLAFLGVRRWAK